MPTPTDFTPTPSIQAFLQAADAAAARAAIGMGATYATTTQLTAEANSREFADNGISTTVSALAAASNYGNRIGAGTFAADLAEALGSINDRISAKTPSSTTQDIFLGSIRNPDFWAVDVDLTCLATYNSGFLEQIGATAITKRHILTCNHTVIGDGTVIRFKDLAGNPVERTLLSSARVGSTDLRVGRLSADLPYSIKPAKLMGADYAAWYSLNGKPIVYQNQYKKLGIGKLDNVGWLSAGNSPADLWFIPVISGDSGNAWGAILNGEFVMVSLFSTANTGPWIGDVTEGVSGGEIMVAMATLGTVLPLTIHKFFDTRQTPPAAMPKVQSTNASFSVTPADNGRTFEITAATIFPITIPGDLPFPFQCRFIARGAGQIIFVPTGGAVIESVGSNKKSGSQHSIFELLRLTPAGTFNLSGNLVA